MFLKKLKLVEKDSKYSINKKLTMITKQTLIICTKNLKKNDIVDIKSDHIELNLPLDLVEFIVVSILSLKLNTYTIGVIMVEDSSI